jgi:tetratricopeptide (TPR) repeat protein
MINVLIIILLITGLSSGQELQEQFDYARGLFSNEKYFDAVTEFKRLVYFDSLEQFTAEAEYYIGVSYKEGGFYNKAVEYLSSAAMKSEDSSLIRRAGIEIIKSNILRGTVTRAFHLLNETDKSYLSAEERYEINYLRGLAHVFDRNLEQAVIWFRAAGREDMAQLTEEARKKEYSESKAKLFSAILPGLGQFYTGRYLNGVIALGLNALSLYLTINAFTSERVFDGVITGNFLLYRFYSGNIYNAGKFARENNEKIFINYLKEIQKSKLKIEN